MLEKQLLQEILLKACATGADFAEVFVEDKASNNYSLDTGKINSANSSNELGAGIRVALKNQSVYGYTNDLAKESLLNLAFELSQSFAEEVKVSQIDLKELTYDNINKYQKMPKDVSIDEKIRIMKTAYQAAFDYDEVISQVYVRLLDETQTVWIANSENLYVTDERVRVRMAVSAIASLDDDMQSGFEGPGGLEGYEFFDKLDIEGTGKEAARVAKVMIEADECPSGEFPVIIDNKFGGVIFHEACGHPLEATSVAKGLSVFTGKLGEKIAHECVTAIDDGTIPNAWGSGNVDDEGNKTEKTVLIENGILKSYLVDKLNARRMPESKANGASRRQSYKFQPTSRMSNTFIDNGKNTVEELIENTEFGLFAKKMGGGSVNPSTGDFNFSVMEGYLIENGKLTKPVKGATLVGNGATVLTKIDMVANNLERAQGMCGSSSGALAADVGQPTLRVSSMTVGGRGGAL